MLFSFILFFVCSRPATAGPRYRHWKTWLQETPEPEIDASRRAQNELAFRTWLTNKRHQGALSPSDSEDPDGENITMATRQNDKAFTDWLEKKKRTSPRPGSSKPSQAVFELGLPDKSTMKRDYPTNNIVAYKRWKATQKRYKLWKQRRGDGDSSVPEDQDSTRLSLLLGGITYKEWLGLKERQRKARKLNVHTLHSNLADSCRV